MLSFILILVVCPENKSFQWLLSALNTWERAWVLQWTLDQTGWCIWPPVDVHVLLRKVPSQPQTEPSAGHSERSHSSYELHMAWNLLYNVCVLLSGKRILDLKNGCLWCWAWQNWSVGNFSFDCNGLERHVLSGRLMKGFQLFSCLICTIQDIIEEYAYLFNWHQQVMLWHTDNW